VFFLSRGAAADLSKTERNIKIEVERFQALDEIVSMHLCLGIRVEEGRCRSEYRKRWVVGGVGTHVKGSNILPPAASGWSGNRSMGESV